MASSWLDAFRQDHLRIIDGSNQEKSGIEQRVARMQGFSRPDTPGRLDLSSTLNALDWLRVLEIRQATEQVNDVGFSRTLTALSRLGRVSGYLVGGHNGESTVCMGIEKSHGRLLRTAVEGSLEVVGQDSLPGWLAQSSKQLASLVYSGIPSQSEHADNRPQKRQTVSAIDQTLRVLRSIRGIWLFMLLFQPVDAMAILDWQFTVSEQVRRVRVDYRQPGTTTSFSRIGQRYEELLDDYLKLLDQAIAEGGWLTYGITYAPPEAIQQVHAALAAGFAGPHSRPESWRLRAPGTRVFTINDANWSGQLTFLPSNYLARMVCLPTQEHVGIGVVRTSRFDLMAPMGEQPAQSPDKASIVVGNVVDGVKKTDETIQFAPQALATHVFVAGITGSGKSTTVQTLISQVVQQGVKLLVIEPVKREYRRLDVPGLRIFSLGDPGCELVMNPFAFEGVSCSTHLDHLKSLFSAAYVLYPPMPYILEQALYEVYRDKGWDFASGINWRTQQRHPRSFPSLTDLYSKTGDVIARSGYGPRLEPEIKAALEVRINNMRIGAKGALLDTPHSLTLDELITQPTVLELQGIGDPEQRAFLMGLILTKIYEGGIAAGPSERLRLVVVLEEAHRLLEERPGGGEDFANPQEKAIETFGDMLAELRAYGVGLIVAEQSPSRITRQVLKNTATKFAHQLVDATERELMAGSMVMTEDESQDLATLPPGQMLMFSHGMNRPMRIQVAAQEHAKRTGQPSQPISNDTAAAKQSAMKASLRDDPHMVRAVLRLLSVWLFGVRENDHTLADVSALVRERTPVAEDNERALHKLTTELIKYNLDKIISSWGRLYGWSFEVEEEVLSRLNAYAEQSLTRPQHPPYPERNRLLTLMRVPKPFAGCRDCSQPCMYRPFIQFLELNRLTSVINRAGRDNDLWEEVELLVEEQAASVVDGAQETRTGAQRCLLAHATAHSDLPRGRQTEVVSRVMLELEHEL